MKQAYANIMETSLGAGRHILSLVLLLIFLQPLFLYSQQEVDIPGTRLPESEENLAKGKEIYTERCSFCHGEEGDGGGPVADYLFPRPRDFQFGVFKFRTTQDGDPPLDSDLYRTISRGIPGTAMPEWGSLLSEDERWQVIQYVKSFGADFFEGIEPVVIEIGDEISASEAVVAEGRALYEKMKCAECHGEHGRGDGSSSSTLMNDWGYKVYPFNYAESWKFKGGNRARDIYMRFTTGVNGTPMPTFALNLNEEERWKLAHYVKSVAREVVAGSEVVLVAKLIDGALPTSADDAAWQQTQGLAIPLAGQIITKPRWQNNSITTIYLRAIYNSDEIAFLVEWDDRTKNVTHDDSEVDLEALMADTYVPASHLYEEKKLRDAISLQFPVKLPTGPEKPHFFWGQAGKKVNLWKWHADRAESGEHQSAVLELNGSGYKNALQPQPDSSQTTVSASDWQNGTWRAVIRRSLTTADKTNDIQFESGKLIPLAVQAWDGARGETDKIMGLSAWGYVTLDSPTPYSAYLYGLLGVLLAALFELWLIRRVRRPSANVAKSEGVGQTAVLGMDSGA